MSERAPTAGHETTLDTPARIRLAAREGRLTGPTEGLAPGYVQCNIAIVAGEHAGHFAEFCERNRRACPVLARSAPGDPALPGLGAGIDVRRDLPAYTVFEHGRPARTVADVEAYWRGDLVTFAFGCSFSFDEALRREGVDLRYQARGDSPALYVTDLPAEPAGPFAGPIAVSMRPLRPADAVRAITVTARYPEVHGEPVHIGLPALIGIVDIDRPDQTLTRTRVLEDELPVFWACGVTGQMALQRAGLPLCISHASAHMLVTDVRLSDLRQA